MQTHRFATKQLDTMKTEGQSRREFLRQGAIVVGVVGAFPTIVPHTVLGRNGRPGPNSRINVGCIGVGSQGRGDMSNFLNQKDARVMVVCDVKQDQLELARTAVNQKYGDEACATTDDYREVLERRDIDACLIATPDHWHVPMAIAAVQAGKDIYLEKPLGLSVEDDWRLRKECQRRKAVFQFGTQQRSGRMFRLACELVRNGYIGRLERILAWAPGSAPGWSTEVVPPPAGLNYDAWIGPAPVIPHTRDLCSDKADKKTWWYKQNFTLGFISGWGIHPLDIAVWGAGSLLAGNCRVSGRGTYYFDGACDTATVWNIDFQFGSGVALKFVGTPNGGNRGLPTNDPWPQREEWTKRYKRISTHGTVFEGAEGWVHVDREGIHFQPEHLIDIDPESFKVRLTQSSDHVRNFLDCTRSRVQTVCPVDDAVQVDTLCHLADTAARLNRALEWNPDKERFEGDAEANLRLRARKPRTEGAGLALLSNNLQPRGVRGTSSTTGGVRQRAHGFTPSSFNVVRRKTLRG